MSQVNLKILGVLLVAGGTAKLFSNLQIIRWSLVNLFQPGAFTVFHDYVILNVEFMFFFLFLPLAILISGIGVFRIRKWGWKLAILVCAITFLVNFIGIINFAHAVYELQSSPMPPLSEGALNKIMSMWPTYVSALVSALLIVFLTLKSTIIIFNNR